ncbi:TPA: hypothetical protein R4S16_003868, partial [Citrobacter amalonaticus]|nr:hypothetical protein [Citrobacter amalonaticus]
MTIDFKKTPAAIAVLLAILSFKSTLAETNYNSTVVINGDEKHFSDDTSITPDSGNGLELKGSMGVVNAGNDAVISINVVNGSGISAITSAATPQIGNASVILGKTHINSSSYGIHAFTLLNNNYKTEITLGDYSVIEAQSTALNTQGNVVVTIGNNSSITGGPAGPSVGAVSASNGANILIGNDVTIINNNTSVNANAIAVRVADASGSALTGAKVTIGTGAVIKTTATGSGNHAVKAGNTDFWTGSGIIEIDKDAVISTVGTSSYGVYNAYTGSIINLNDAATISTTGNSSSAIRSGTSVDYSGGDIIVGKQLVISTLGNSAYGLHSVYNGSKITIDDGSRITTSGQSSNAVYSQNAGVINIGNYTEISTTGSSAYGLYATGSGSEISTGESAAVSTDGSNSYGIYATSSSSVLVGEGISVTTNGTSAHGIYSSNASVTLGDGGSITVNSADKTSIFSKSPNGIYATSRGLVNLDGGMTVTMAGDHQSDSYAMNADSGGIIDGSAGGRFVVSGDILSSGGSAANSSAPQQNSTITLNMTEGSLWTGASYIGTTTSGNGIIDLTMKDAVWNVTDSSTVTSMTLNSGGIINFLHTDDNVWQSLTVSGDYAGNGGQLVFNTVLSDDNS